jgi:hypothetical protein
MVDLTPTPLLEERELEELFLFYKIFLSTLQ